MYVSSACNHRSDVLSFQESKFCQKIICLHHSIHFSLKVIFYISSEIFDFTSYVLQPDPEAGSVLFISISHNLLFSHRFRAELWL